MHVRFVSLATPEKGTVSYWWAAFLSFQLDLTLLIRIWRLFALQHSHEKTADVSHAVHQAVKETPPAGQQLGL